MRYLNLKINYPKPKKNLNLLPMEKKKPTKARKQNKEKNCKRCKHDLPVSKFSACIRKHKLASGEIKIYTYYDSYCKPCKVIIVKPYEKPYDAVKQSAAFKRWYDKQKKQGLNPNQRPKKKKNVIIK